MNTFQRKDVDTQKLYKLMAAAESGDKDALAALQRENALMAKAANMRMRRLEEAGFVSRETGEIKGTYAYERAKYFLQDMGKRYFPEGKKQSLEQIKDQIDEEIKFMLEILGEHKLDLPIILDWEIPVAEARTTGVTRRALTDMLKHFNTVMTGKGFTTMVYFNWNMSRNLLILSELENQPFWLALYQDRMTYPYKVEMWQYTDKGRVPGIQGDVDINVYMQ